MTEEQKQQIQKRIEERLAELERTIKGLKELAKPIAPDNALGRITRAEAQQTQGLHEDNLTKAEYSYATLKDVLTHIHEESFGLCTWCNAPINFDRLLAIPETSKCVRCA